MEDKQRVASHILVVDDKERNLNLLEASLYPEGHWIESVRSGAQALESAKRDLPDLILLDIMMPEMDGFEVCQKLKDDPDTREIPVIFLTAKSDKDSIVKGFELGAVDYINKPFNIAELIARVNTHLRLKRTQQELQQANREKDIFYSIIAHDIKNPFHQLFGISDMMRRRFSDMTDQKKQKLIKNIYEITKNTYNLLDNLLEWSRYQSGRLTRQAVEFDVSVSVNDVVDLQAAIADSKKISLISGIERNTRVFADRNMITTVLRNLVSNAIKFTADGGQVQVSAQAQDNMLEITVADNGLGIAGENIHKLFDDNSLHSTTGTNYEKGSGLGLALCKEFVEINLGKIWVTSEQGKGSHFHFTIPLSQ